MRTGKAWVLKKVSNYRERRLCSYNKHKIAFFCKIGGSEEFVPGAMEVYAVSKKKSTTDDYHDNV